MKEDVFAFVYDIIIYIYKRTYKRDYYVQLSLIILQYQENNNNEDDKDEDNTDRELDYTPFAVIAFPTLGLKGNAFSQPSKWNFLVDNKVIYNLFWLNATRLYK